MTTKQFKVSHLLIAESIKDLMMREEKINKTTITNNITRALSNIIEKGDVDYPPFPNWDEEFTEDNKIKLDKYFIKYHNI